MSDITCASLNVRGLREVKKRKETFKFLREHNFDIVCIQETHSQEGDEKRGGQQNEYE